LGLRLTAYRVFGRGPVKAAMGAAETSKRRNHMSDNTNTETSSKATRKPSYIAYSIREREGKDSKWTEIGVAFPHKDGKGFDILCEVVPLNKRITIRLPLKKD
jgi:hypothetical protein